MNEKTVTIVDYGVGNILSVKRSLEHFDVAVNITSNAKEVLNSEKLILPGVGAFPNAMNALRRLDLIEPLSKFSETGRPMLAICLGMQLLMESSSEHIETEGLGIFKGHVKRIPEDNLIPGAKVPHVGWNSISPSVSNQNWGVSILRDTQINSEMYFVHSYMVVPENQQDELAFCFVNEVKVCAGITNGHITGLQFHPEKSGILGLEIIKKFVNDGGLLPF